MIPKKIKKFSAVFLASALLLEPGGSWQNVIPNTTITAEAAAVKISKTSVSVYVGDSLKLSLKNTNKTPTWSSSKSNVATVSSSGKVKAKKAGTTTITAKIGGKKYTCKVTVKKRKVTSVSIQKEKTSLDVGDTNQLKIKVKPEDATNSDVSFSSSDTSVAIVDSAGKVQGIGEGSAVITATAKDGSGKKDSYTVTVTSNIRSVCPKADDFVLDAFEKIGFKVKIDPNVNYTGLTDARTRTITFHSIWGTAPYHELGHFVAFLADNYDRTPSFYEIYESEKDKYRDYDCRYIQSTPYEYFASSYKDYVLNPSELQSTRPKTYEAIVYALSKITDAQISRYLSLYTRAGYWN